MTEHQYDLDLVERVIFDGNIDWDTDDITLCFGLENKYQGKAIGIKTFIGWMSSGYINPIQRQNFSPAHWELAVYAQQLMSMHENIHVYYGGYVVHPERDDARIGIDTVYVTSPSDNYINEGVMIDMKGLLPDSDECHRMDGAIRMWWD
jgi:hypothetical protein